MIEREWWVQVNLDDLSHVTAQMETTEERGQWLEGFLVGAQGHPARDSWDGFKRMGFEFGASCHTEAVAFRSSKSAAGKASADARRAKYGSASPNSVRAVFEHTSEQEPEQTSEQTPNQPTTNNQQPTTRSEQPRTRFVPPTLDELTAYAKEIGFRDFDKWMDHYTSNGWMVGKSKMKDWKACVRNWNRNPMQSNGFQRPKQKLTGFTPEYMEQGRIVRNDGLDF
jgi:hypothetical protein